MNDEITLGEEEIADVSLATFYVFDKENADHRGAAKGWRVAVGRAPITRQEMMLIRPRFVRSRSHTGTCRSTFRKARGRHDQAQPPT